MPSIPRAECFHSLAYTNDYWERRVGAAGGRKLAAERQGAERQDEERATEAEQPEEDATRWAWRIRLGRSNLPLLHARRLALLAYRTGRDLSPPYRVGTDLVLDDS